MHRRFKASAPLLILAGAVLASVLVQPAKKAVAQRGKPVYVEGEVLVAYKPGTDVGLARRAEQNLRATVSRTFMQKDLRLLKLAPGITTDAAVRTLNADPSVAHAQ